jgi:peroxiredoxin
MSGSPSDERAGNDRWRRTRPSFLVTGAVVAVLACLLWHPPQQISLMFFLLHTEAPSNEVLSSAMEQNKDRGAFLKRLWETGELPHRAFTARYLSRISSSNKPLIQDMERVLMQAADDVDIETRQLAFSALQTVKHPQLRHLALQQLSDADPAARLIGLQALRTIASTNDVALGIQTLSDPDPRVVVAAGQLLRAATGLDFGLKSSLAMPQFAFVGTDPLPQPDLAGLGRGVQRWGAWWGEHKTEYPASTGEVQPHAAPLKLPSKDFRLADGKGKSIRLSDHRGKTVMLAFWSLDIPESLDLSGLANLQSHEQEHLVLMAICMPPAPSCADEHEHSHGEDRQHAHHHHHTAGAVASNPARIQALAEKKSHSASFIMLRDPEGALARRFNVEDRPTYVLIDSEGMIRRRFVGMRTESALQTIVEELRAPDSTSKSTTSH